MVCQTNRYRQSELDGDYSTQVKNWQDARTQIPPDGECLREPEAQLACGLFLPYGIMARKIDLAYLK
jgi:hypothetical protein